MVPIFYSTDIIPRRFNELYQFNPVAALVIALRSILMEGVAPHPPILWKLGGSSLVMIAVGLFVFRKLQEGFYDYL